MRVFHIRASTCASTRGSRTQACARTISARETHGGTHRGARVEVTPHNPSAIFGLIRELQVFLRVRRSTTYHVSVRASVEASGTVKE